MGGRADQMHFTGTVHRETEFEYQRPPCGAGGRKRPLEEPACACPVSYDWQPSPWVCSPGVGHCLLEGSTRFLKRLLEAFTTKQNQLSSFEPPVLKK
jgi:hypothetical protein